MRTLAFFAYNVPTERRFARRVRSLYCKAEGLLCLAHQSREHSHRVPQQLAVGRIVDVRLRDGAVDTHLAAGLDAFSARVHQEQLVDLLERLGLDALHVALERRAPWRSLVGIQAAEGPKARRVREVERQFLVAEAVHLLEQERAKDLIGSQAGATRPWVLPPLRKVSENEIEHLRMSVEDGADRLQLIDVLMLDSMPGGWREGQLLL